MALKDKVKEDQWKEHNKIYLLSQTWITHICANTILDFKQNKQINNENLAKEIKKVLFDLK